MQCLVRLTLTVPRGVLAGQTTVFVAFLRLACAPQIDDILTRGVRELLQA